MSLEAAGAGPCLSDLHVMENGRVALSWRRQMRSVIFAQTVDIEFLHAAVDVSDRAPHGPARDHAANAGDRHERKQQDFDDLVDHAMERSGSKRALVPSKSKKKMQQIDLNKLTRSKRQLVVEQALEACN